MILVDTSVWVSFLRKTDPDLSDILKKYLKKEQVYAVSAVFGELLQGAKNNRERHLISVLWENLQKVTEEDLFIAAGNLSNRYKLYASGVGLIDCFILAAAMENNLALWTLDKKLQKAVDLVSES